MIHCSPPLLIHCSPPLLIHCSPPLAAIFLFGIEELGIQIEEPFGILPLEALCDGSIEGVVMDMRASYTKGHFGSIDPIDRIDRIDAPAAAAAPMGAGAGGVSCAVTKESRTKGTSLRKGFMPRGPRGKNTAKAIRLQAPGLRASR